MFARHVVEGKSKKHSGEMVLSISSVKPCVRFIQAPHTRVFNFLP